MEDDLTLCVGENFLRWSRKGEGRNLPKEERDPAAVAAGMRLRKARVAAGVPTVRRLAQLTDEPEANVGKWERGEAMVPPEFVEKLRTIYRIDHNWIYAGDASSLPHKLAINLLAKDNDLES